MRSYLIDTKSGIHREVDHPDDLRAFYNTLDCETIDIVTRTLGGRTYDIVCDDEALLGDYPIPSATDAHGNIVLCNSLLFFHHDSDGNLTPISEEDVVNIRRHVRRCTFFKGSRTSVVNIVTGMEY